MTRNHSAVKILSLSIASVAIASGCTTSGPKESKKDDLAAAKKSQVYLESTVLIPASQKTVNASCVLTKEAEKPVYNQTNEPTKDWRSLVARANTCVAEKNWRTLESIANILARNDMDSPWGAYFLSVAAEANKDFTRAMWMIDLAQKKAGGRSGLYLYQKGRIMYAMGEIAKSMNEIRKAVQMEPSLADGHLFLAETHHRDSEFDKAGLHYAAALLVEEKNYRTLTGLAEVRLHQGKHDEAVDLYQKAVASHPNSLRPWVRLAFIYETIQKNSQLALNTYKVLKTRLDSGKLREKPDFDLNAKIKSLEEVVRIPAQASAVEIIEPRSKK